MRFLLLAAIGFAATAVANGCSTGGGSAHGAPGGPCRTTKDCPSATVCGYFLDNLCAAKGVCVVSDCTVPDCSDVYGTTSGWCGCDGGTVVPVATEYTSAPYGNQIGNCGDLDASSGPDAPDATGDAEVFDASDDSTANDAGADTGAD